MHGKTLIALATFAAVLATPHARAAGHPRFAAELPFRDCNGLICFQARIDGGAPRTLVLDTGDVASAMLAGPAKAQGWQPKPVLQAGKPVPGILDGGRHRVSLGGTQLDVHFAVYGPKAFGPHALPGDGALAYTAFKDRVLQIDYPHHRLRISAPVTAVAATDPAAGTLERVTFGHRGPPIVVGAPFTVDGHAVHAQIDTMFTGTMLVYDAALDRLGLHRHGTPTRFDFTDGGVEMLAAPARSLGFGQHPLLGAGATMYFAGSGKPPVHQPDGLFEATVGNALFVHSVVTMDFHAMTLDVRPAK